MPTKSSTASGSESPFSAMIASAPAGPVAFPGRPVRGCYLLIMNWLTGSALFTMRTSPTQP
jgi:hypothetical protein